MIVNGDSASRKNGVVDESRLPTQAATRRECRARRFPPAAGSPVDQFDVVLTDGGGAAKDSRALLSACSCGVRCGGESFGLADGALRTRAWKRSRG